MTGAGKQVKKTGRENGNNSTGSYTGTSAVENIERYAAHARPFTRFSLFCYIVSGGGKPNEHRHGTAGQLL
ncbi:hypothetical protein [Prosthecochloris sp. GSB1]|uniref:hypothetical protein n=1 Tax=Prosthecochloris sp. GSB1 TaxID=281093 RepID=UPI0012371797|nr:hypothetical protein [Prosthecochloris sp. GSB1]